MPVGLFSAFSIRIFQIVSIVNHPIPDHFTELSLSISLIGHKPILRINHVNQIVQLRVPGDTEKVSLLINKIYTFRKLIYSTTSVILVVFRIVITPGMGTGSR